MGPMLNFQSSDESLHAASSDLGFIEDIDTNLDCSVRRVNVLANRSDFEMVCGDHAIGQITTLKTDDDTDVLSFFWPGQISKELVVGIVREFFDYGNSLRSCEIELWNASDRPILTYNSFDFGENFLVAALDSAPLKTTVSVTLFCGEEKLEVLYFWGTLLSQTTSEKQKKEVGISISLERWTNTRGRVARTLADRIMDKYIPAPLSSREPVQTLSRTMISSAVEHAASLFFE